MMQCPTIAEGTAIIAEETIHQLLPLDELPLHDKRSQMNGRLSHRTDKTSRPMSQ